MQDKFDAVESATRIPGWTTRQELTWLYEVASDILPKDAAVAEIGSWFGRSAWVLAAGMRTGDLFLIDPCEPKAVPGSLPTYEYLLQPAHLSLVAGALNEYGGCPRTHLYQGTSEDAASDLQGIEFSMVWIDADHSYEACLKDIELWTPRLAKGGIICGHDYGDVYTQGVTRAVNECFGEPNITRCGSIWAVVPHTL